MTNFAFWAALPWVLPQAIWVRRQTPRFRGPSGELRGEVGEQARQRIVGIGDSIIAGVGAQASEETITAQLALCWHQSTGTPVEWVAHGKIGARTARIKRLAESLEQDERVSLVLISAGVNDITGLTAVDAWLADLESLVTILEQRYSQARLVLLGIPPLDVFPALPMPLRQVLGSRARYYDESARRYASTRTGLSYAAIESRPKPAEFAADGFHPSATSYAALARDIVNICRDSIHA